MKIVFVSNYYNHHQSALSNALYRLTDGKYRFIATEPIEEERLKMGWSDQQDSFVMQYEHSRAECQSLIDEADTVIIGSAPHYIVKKRILDNKLVLKYSERQLKKGLEIWKYPHRFIKWHSMYPNNKNTYLLCASAYAAKDYSIYGLFKNRAYKWGYFPKVKKYENIEKIIEHKKPASILWVARFIDWKHPEIPIKIAKRLKEENCKFSLNMIGNGEMENTIRQMIDNYNLSDCVHLLGSMKPDNVREHMEQSQIFLFTSDRNEGWGAVLNESMNSGCAVVASHAIGAVPYLMRNQENGLIYHSGNVDELYKKVKYLLDNPGEQERLGKAAYETIVCEWNAEVAAERLINLSEHLLAGEKYPDLYPAGPCSRAEMIKDDWFYE